ncbi:hypothetical protein RND71_000043 [Anisodus tanguticus]|uniref:Uncharacterized protein n=1 Tax=Anisodus tanguticus TaxID=243964 RepID=A0AAE1SYQ8_9SOLA|nr:hypothetical protein RND71_000043 [Anisodus tanguticus]
MSSIKHSNFTNLFSGKNSTDIILSLDDNWSFKENFSERVSWVNKVEGFDHERICNQSFLLGIKKDKRRILQPYLQHIHTVSDEIEQRRKELKIFPPNEALRGANPDIVGLQCGYRTPVTGPTALRPHTPENPTSGLALRISIHRLALRVWSDFFGEHISTLADQRTRTRNLRQQYPNVLATGPNTSLS